MKYADALQQTRDMVRDGAADAVIAAIPYRTPRGLKAAHMRQAAIDGLTEALIDEILDAAIPGYEDALAEMVGLRIMTEVSRLTAAGSA